MRRVRIGALGLGLLVLAGPACAALFDGRWSNVCMSRVTGDQGGMELVLNGSSARLKVCEGGCWAMPVRDVAVKGQAIAFTATDRSYDADGKLAESRDVRFEGRFSGATLRLGAAGFWEAQVLRQQKADPPRMAAEERDEDWPGAVRVCR